VSGRGSEFLRKREWWGVLEFCECDSQNMFLVQIDFAFLFLSFFHGRDIGCGRQLVKTKSLLMKGMLQMIGKSGKEMWH